MPLPKPISGGLFSLFDRPSKIANIIQCNEWRESTGHALIQKLFPVTRSVVYHPNAKRVEWDEQALRHELFLRALADLLEVRGRRNWRRVKKCFLHLPAIPAVFYVQSQNIEIKAVAPSLASLCSRLVVGDRAVWARFLAQAKILDDQRFFCRLFDLSPFRAGSWKRISLTRFGLTQYCRRGRAILLEPVEFGPERKISFLAFQPLTSGEWYLVPG